MSRRTQLVVAAIGLLLVAALLLLLLVVILARPDEDTLSLSERTFVCDECGLVIDRDQNAAMNLQHHTVSSTEINACGDGRLQSSGTVPVREAGTKH